MYSVIIGYRLTLDLWLDTNYISEQFVNSYLEGLKMMPIRYLFVSIVSICINFNLIEAFIPRINHNFNTINRLRVFDRLITRNFLSTADFKNGITLDIGEFIKFKKLTYVYLPYKEGVYFKNF